MKNFFCGVILSILSLGSAAEYDGINTDNVSLLPSVIDQYNTVSVKLPTVQLANHSLQVSTPDDKVYTDWTGNDHSNSFTMLQKVASIWKENHIADQYLIYGKIQTGSEIPFNWEVVPYYTPNTVFGRIWQQLCVLWKICFGGSAPTETQKFHQIQDYKKFFAELQNIPEKVNTIVMGNDPFCKPEVINRQSVLEGKRINILYNHAPIGFGGERLHFLVVPKEHRIDFGALESEEYVEASELAQALVKHFSKTRPLQEIHLFHKTGRDAGQTVPHWHMHVIMTSNSAQGVFGKLTVLKNMLLGSSPMNAVEFENKVASLSAELKHIKYEY